MARAAARARSGDLLDRAQLPALYVTHDHEEAFALADRIVMMREGRVVQVGVPSEVWRHPADEWTAAFLGFGPAVDGAFGADGLVTPWGTLAVAGKHGRAVRVMVRPDAVTIDGAGPIAGLVVRSAFAGDRTELTVEAGGAALRVRVPDRDAPDVGARVALDDRRRARARVSAARA